ncbi:response regulator [Paenibacillus aceris]|uniref:Two-component system response regulator YesN n=1 Tax=Paenibacillus aceris TaxID=869555 RepID=A0ABS4I772_9BACL|nr:helix-turn-helix domain-containing protein [Paenibacillus aceris]MBP1966748.1 two-component system response regulator YesN [Paenibacillus aceris]NHW39375.1 response regulator [Paenibacillus aceris]
MKIMIVDDEVIIRTGLAKVIKWHEIGVDLLQPAASAEEALRRIPEEHPHILLTDIRMKRMNGLELAKKAKELLPEIEVIILSGYDDFVYMQEAIRQGVSDYLLKTSRPEEIMKTVLKVKQSIEEKWKHHNQDQYKNKEIRNRLFEQWIIEGATSAIDSALLSEYMPLLFPRPSTGDCKLQVYMIAAEGWAESTAATSLLLFAVDNILHELLKCETLIYKQQIIVATRNELGTDPNNHPSAALGKIERLLKCKIWLSIGEPVYRVEDLHKSYITADYAYSYKPILEQSLLDYSDIVQRKGGRTVCSHEEELELSAILLENDSIALKSWVHRFLQPEYEDPQMTIDSLESKIRSAALSAHRWLERVLTATGRSGNIEEQISPLTLKRGTLLKDVLFQHLLALMELYHHRLGEGKATHTQKAMAYIQQNLGNDVGLQQVAKFVHLHPNHLSEVFKKEAGITFGDYVTRQRINRAMEILTGSPAKIAEIAGAVGFEDIKYFSQVFKKFTGKTPSEFREEATKHVRHTSKS